MMRLLEISFIGLLAFITYQDFRYRAISIWTIPVFAIIISVINLQFITVVCLLENSFINLTFFCIQLLLVFFYFSLKEKKLVNIINTQIGTGDIFFVVALCFVFSPPDFVIFMVSALCTSVVGYLIVRIFRFKVDTIPLAGSFALILGVIWLIKLATGVDQIYAVNAIDYLVIR